MVTELRIYFEGDVALRPGFHRFLNEIVEAARSRQCRCRPIATGATPVEDFCDALQTHREAWNVLLLDSDGPIEGPLGDLCRAKGIDASQEESVFWMVQVMESWFLADIAALKAYFGNAFREGSVRWNPKVEEIPKADIIARLNKASGRRYHKTKDAVKLLAMIDPAKVRRAAPNCERMFKRLLSGLAEA